MAKRAHSSHDTKDAVDENMSPTAGPKTGLHDSVKKMRELDRLLAQYDNYFPGFTSAVLKLAQNKW